MPKVTKPLTNTEINNARGKAKEYNLADGLGLALRVRPGGDSRCRILVTVHEYLRLFLLFDIDQLYNIQSGNNT
jgi:hypothetical protein